MIITFIVVFLLLCLGLYIDTINEWFNKFKKYFKKK